eukprot:COSAG03_NODE_1519_length_3940_cov_70.632648_1_plen_50_part_10
MGSLRSAPSSVVSSLALTLETEVLPKFVAILTDQTPNAPGDQLEVCLSLS